VGSNIGVVDVQRRDGSIHPVIEVARREGIEIAHSRSKPMIKRVMMTFTIICLLIGPIAVAQDKNTEAAQEGAESWLAIVDKGDYAGSYDRAAIIFKLAITKEEWLQKVRAGARAIGEGDIAQIEARAVRNVIARSTGWRVRGASIRYFVREQAVGGGDDYSDS
jgi:hypothetical protein